MIGIEETPLYNDIRGKMESHYTVEGVLKWSILYNTVIVLPKWS